MTQQFLAYVGATTIGLVLGKLAIEYCIHALWDFKEIQREREARLPAERPRVVNASGQDWRRDAR